VVAGGSKRWVEAAGERQLQNGTLAGAAIFGIVVSAFKPLDAVADVYGPMMVRCDACARQCAEVGELAQGQVNFGGGTRIVDVARGPQTIGRKCVRWQETIKGQIGIDT